MNQIPKIIAFYLPQFHPIPENDEWWGKGFTEWTNVGKAKPLYKGHYQPRVPADLGYYDLRLPIIREQQAELAREAGVYGFCYWHYWFGNGKELIEGPFNEVLNSGKPDFPFCLAWANTSWIASSWKLEETKKTVLQEQLYPGEQDNYLHFTRYKKAFADRRYIRINNRPVFLIYRPFKFPDISSFFNQWNELIKQEKIAESFYFVACTDLPEEHEKAISLGFDAVTCNPIKRMEKEYDNKSYIHLQFLRVMQHFTNRPYKVIPYKKAIKHIFTEEDKREDTMPIIMPNWDRSPRAGKYAVIWDDSRPSYFKEHVQEVLNGIRNKNNKIIFLKSWNEWAEGNYMEPDTKFGHGYIKALKEALDDEKLYYLNK